MPKMRSLYTDAETEELIKKILKREPTFKVSNFFRVALVKYTGRDTEDINELYKKIADNKLKIDYFNNENIFIENQINEIKSKEVKTVEEKSKEAKAKERYQRFEDFYKGKLIPNKYSEEEYLKGIKENKWKNPISYYESVYPDDIL